MPYIEEIYNEYNKNQDDVIILGVASPEVGREGTQEHVEKYLQKEGFTFPVAMDIKGGTMYKYGINSFPSTFIINKEGYIEKYIPGAINKSTMENLIENAFVSNDSVFIVFKFKVTFLYLLEKYTR